MSNETKLNSQIQETAINPMVGRPTAVNPVLTARVDLPVGTVLAGRYTVKGPLSVSAGEADLYLCTCEGKEYVAKLYRRAGAIKPEVAAELMTLDSPYIAPLYETGSFRDLPFEILPYYKNGSLQGRRYTAEELKTKIIPAINRALRVLHEREIIHKDLKPSNIMLADGEAGVVLIDFGISSVIEDGNTVVFTQTGMTPEYSAPETFKNLFLEESDYYSFGITVFELCCGYTPYRNLSAEEIARFTAVQRLPFPKDMPQDLQELISGMTYFDITNRHEKQNPHRRWTYEEVEKWCRGEKQTVPGEGLSLAMSRPIPTYEFFGKSYTELPELVTALATHWQEGKKQLYRGHLTSFFRNYAPPLGELCAEAEQEAAATVGRDDVIFWELLYRLYPELKAFYWMGNCYESLPALGRDMLEKLWNGQTADRKYWDGILEQKLLSVYLEFMQTENEELRQAVAALEADHLLVNGRERERILNYYLLAYLLSGQILLRVDDKQLKNVTELTNYMRSLLDVSYQRLEQFCHRIIDYGDTLDVQLEAWLIAQGKRRELDTWKQQLV